MKKGIFFALAFITFSSLVSAQEKKADEQAIKNIVNNMQNGWNEKLGEKFASDFAESNDFIVWNGYYFPNGTKKGTAQNHQRLFDGPFKTMDIQLKIDKIRFIRNDIALVHVLGASYTKGQPLPTDPEILMSLVMEKKDNQWQIVSFHNLDLESFKDKETAARSPMPVNVMYANWYK